MRTVSLSSVTQASLRAIARIPPFLQPLLIVGLSLLLLHPIWSAGTDDAGARERPQAQAPERRVKLPIEAAEARELVERTADFKAFKIAVVPRQLPSYHVIASNPDIKMLRELKYITVTEEWLSGGQTNVIEITPTGRTELFGHWREDADSYTLTLASRRIEDGTFVVQGANEKGKPDPNETLISFTWVWEPANAFARRIPMTRTYDARQSAYGLLRRERGRWNVAALRFDDRSIDYVKRQ